MDLKHYEIKDGEGYYDVVEALVTITNKNNDDDWFEGYADVRVVEMYWEGNDEFGMHGEKEIFEKGYGFNGKVYNSVEELENDGYELEYDEDSPEERPVWCFETLEEAEKYALEQLKEKAEKYSFD